MSEIVPAEEFFWDERGPWDRLDGESPADFAWFRMYRDMRRERSYRAVVNRLGLSYDALEKAGRRHSWVARAEAFDEREQRLILAELEGDQAEIRARHKANARDVMERAMQAVAATNPSFILPKDIPIWLEISAKLERLSAGMGDAPKKIEITGKDGAPIEMVSTLNAQERAVMMAEVQEELAKRLAVRAALEAAADDGIEDAEIVEGE